MRYNRLGSTGLFVSELALGTMTFAGGDDAFWGVVGNLGQQDADRLIARSVEAGINFIDTADIYSSGRSEIMTGQAIRNLGIPREEIVIATKAFGRTGPGPNNHGSSRLHLLHAAKASLKRLNTDYIDLYQLHGFDEATPIEETLDALDTLVCDGLVRYVGVSNWAAWQIATALGVSGSKGITALASLQAYYNVAARDLERELVPLLDYSGLGLLVWSPLAGGLLSGKFSGNSAHDAESRRARIDFPPMNAERTDAVIEALRPMAATRNVSIARIALAWLLHRKAVTSVIIGAKTIAQLDDNISSIDIGLTKDELETLDRVSALAPEYPGWMFDELNARRARQILPPRQPL